MNRSIAIVFAVFSAWSSAALGQPAGAQAEVLFRQGRDLLAAGKVAEACSAFEESQKLEAAVTTLLNLAGCREKQGQLATAWGLFLDAARQTRSAADATSRQFHDVAQARAKKLEPRVCKLTVNVWQQSQIDGLEVARDGESNQRGDVEPCVAGRRGHLHDHGARARLERVVDSGHGWSGGRHQAGRDSRSAQPAARPRKAPHAPVALAATACFRRRTGERSSEPAADRAITPIAQGNTTRGRRGCARAAGGGLGFELWAESRYDAAKAEMMSQPGRDSLESAANTKRYVAEALAVGGLAAGGATVWLYLRDGKRERPAPAEASVHVVPAVTGLALTGRF